MDKSSASRIGLIGGTFNPLHIGHLLLAQSAVETHDLAKVLFIPCGLPPHKNPVGLAAAGHRLAMLQAAIEDDLWFEATDIEIQRGGPSFAVDTVAELHALYPAAELHFIIGADTLTELHQWKNIYSLLALCRFVTFARPGFDLDRLRPDDLRLQAPWAERLLRNVTVGRRIDVSSSDIRHRLAEGMSIRYLVPRAVEMYVAEHGLYT
jgi:nicotinate-nucleotide adenylyltransferase